jgi:hypothetical protein
MALTKLTSNLIEGGTGTDWVTAIQTSNFTAAAGKGYFVNTTSQVLYVNLPVGVVGTEIVIQDYAGTFATNKVILNANGSEKIQGSALEGEIITNNATAVLIYQDATKGWTSQDISLATTDVSWSTPTGQGLTYSTPSPQSSIGDAGATFPTTTFTATLAGSTISGTATIAGLPSGITAAQTITGSGAGNTLTVTLTGTFPATDSLNTNLTLSGLIITSPLNVNYLVVAGGGGSAADSPGGGGAGGLRTSWPGGSGGGQSSESTLLLAVSTSYTLTIGSGGAAASNGSNSTFSGPSHTISSEAGGRGSGTANGYVAGNGGSGGGGSGGQYNDPGGAAITSPTIQGYRGGNAGTSGGGATYPGAGGGGAGAQGQDSANSGGPGKNGGIGIAVNILNSTNAATSSVGEVSSSDVYYAGGGGGSVSSGTGGTGGTGGGGNGTVVSGNNNGTANTGGGAGGYNGSGGSGVIILRYPSSYTISGLTQATGSPFTEGASKVSVFTNIGTGNITFS